MTVRPNVLHLVDFPLKMSETNLKVQARSVASGFIPSSISFEIKTRNNTTAASFHFKNPSDAMTLFDNCKNKRLHWVEPGADDLAVQASADLHFKRDQTLQQRRNGRLLNVPYIY